jgi:hypothetical protein
VAIFVLNRKRVNRIFPRPAILRRYRPTATPRKIAEIGRASLVENVRRHRPPVEIDEAPDLPLASRWMLIPPFGHNVIGSGRRQGR